MRDARVALFTGTPLTISTATTTYGPTLDLKSGYVGDFFEGSPTGYGLRIEVMFTTITSTNNNVKLKWQVSDDNFSTVDDDQMILEGELSALVTAGGTAGTGTKIIVPSTLRTTARYARLAIVTTGMSGSSFIVNAWLSDGVTDQGRGQNYYRV